MQAIYNCAKGRWTNDCNEEQGQPQLVSNKGKKNIQIGKDDVTVRVDQL